MKKIIQTLILLAPLALCAQNFKEHGRHSRHRHEHHDSAYVPNTQVTQEFNVKVAGQEYKFAFSSDSTIKVNDEKEYAVKKIRPGIWLVSWPDKSGATLSHVIDRHAMKMYTTRLSDKKPVTITSGIGYKKIIEVAPPADKQDSKTGPAKKN